MNQAAAKRGRPRFPTAVGLAAAFTAAVSGSALAQPEQATTVFDVSRSLAIEAARTRLRLFVDDNPEPAEGDITADQPECPLISTESLGNVASVVGSAS